MTLLVPRDGDDYYGIDLTRELSLDEQTMLREACQFMGYLARRIGLPRRTVLAARFYFYRYVAVMTRGVSDFRDVGLGCLLIGAKAEETPVSIKRLLTAALYINKHSNSKGDKDGGAGEHELIKDIGEEQWQRWRHTVCALEGDILEGAGFTFCPPDYCGVLMRMGRTFEEGKEVMRIAFGLLDATSCTCALTTVPVHYLALACIVEGRKRKGITSYRRYQEAFAACFEDDHFRRVCSIISKL
jgi:hypothetical protein